MEEDIRKLIDKYNHLVIDYRREYRPLELTTKEQEHLEAYAGALIRVVGDLREILKNSNCK